MKRIIWILVFTLGFNVYAQKAVLSNFRVEGSSTNRVYFDTSGDISGLTTQGFAISGKTITGVNTTGSYFTVSNSFNFWDNNTIRLKNGNGTVEDFTLSYIENNISEPNASTYRYVTTSATGSGDGTSESNPWTFAQAISKATAGMTVWMKAGNYGNVYATIDRTGTSTNPIKFIGYKNSIGDITSNYYDYGVTMRSSEMPTFTGVSLTDGKYAWYLKSDYVIFRNIQFTHFATGIKGYGANSNLIFERINIYEIGGSYAGSAFSFAPSDYHGNKNFRLLNSRMINGSMANVYLRGDGHALIDGVKTYSDRTNSADRTDYAITIGGDDNIIRNCYAENFNNTETNGSTHGIGVRGGRRLSNIYNLIEKSTAVNFQECFYVRNYGSNYNVIKDCVAKNNGAASSNDRGGLYIQGEANYNTFERCEVTDQDYGFYFIDKQAEDNQSSTAIGTGNTVKNSTFNGSKVAIFIAGTTDVSNPNSLLKDTKFVNCTFNDFQTFISKSNISTNIDNFEITNCSITDVDSGAYNVSISEFTFDHNNFYNSWTSSLGTNSLNANPNFENASSGNFRLKPDSPIIDKGKDLNEIKSDFDRNIRPQGTSTDIGAFEFLDSTTSSVNANAGEDQSICLGESVTLTASGGSTYSWSTGATTQSITVNPNETTTYTVTV
ncbi:MAG: choice-of-anchor Q domain-containing protein, partial [Bacteroidota bacterium]